MNDWNQLTDWAINKIKKEYKEDIALLVAVEGHSTDGDGHGECFDYFIPVTPRGNELAQTFMIDGVGHDLYPRSWERIGRTARLMEFPTACLANARVLYARSSEDEVQFLKLQKQLADNLGNPEYVYTKALERLDEAMDVYRTMIFEEKPYKVRMAAAYIAFCLTQAAALVNGTFADNAIFTRRQAMQTDPQSRMYHCPELLHTPEHFYEYGSMILPVR